MGCTSSNEDVPKMNIKVAKPAKKRIINKEDYIFSNHKNEANETPELFIKGTGTIDGEQFIVEDCTNCCILLLDLVETLTVDSSANVKLICGPCNGRYVIAYFYEFHNFLHKCIFERLPRL